MRNTRRPSAKTVRRHTPTQRASEPRGESTLPEYSSPVCYLHELEDASKGTEGHIRVKRIYEAAQPSDGLRVLVDRLWPRGIRKDEAAIDEWLRDVAPSPELRKWFGHDPERWLEFRRRYRRELASRASRLEVIRQAAERGPVTLLYAARDPQINHTVVLKEMLEEQRLRRSSSALGHRAPPRRKRSR